MILSTPLRIEQCYAETIFETMTEFSTIYNTVTNYVTVTETMTDFNTITATEIMTSTELVPTTYVFKLLLWFVS